MATTSGSGSTSGRVTGIVPDPIDPNTGGGEVILASLIELVRATRSPDASLATHREEIVAWLRLEIERCDADLASELLAHLDAALH